MDRSHPAKRAGEQRSSRWDVVEAGTSAMPHREKTLSDRFQEGVDARQNGLTLDDNPYALGSDERAEWKEGFVAICDLDEEDDPASSRMNPAYD